MVIKGCYIMGSFRKGKKAASYFDIKKPFTIDAQRGEVTPCVFRFWKDNIWFDEWEFLEGYKLADLKNDKDLRKFCNEIWTNWCKKYHRKYKPLFTEEEKE